MRFRPRLGVVVALFLVVVGCSRLDSSASWNRVDPPMVKTETDDVVLDGATLSDGTYWATIALVSGTNDIVFRVLKARFGDTCTKWANDNGMADGCTNDYNVDSYPDAYVGLDKLADVSVAKADGPGTSYSINADTLRQLIKGTTMGDDTKFPDGYTWVPFPFLVTVIDGLVTTAAQYWVP